MERHDGDGMTAVTRLERHVAVVAAVAAGLLCATAALLFLADVELARRILSFMLVEAVLGREASMAVGVTMGLPLGILVLVSLAQTLAFGLLAYVGAVAILSRQQSGILARWAKNVRLFAEHRRTLVQRWGPLGVFLFMLVPFLINGPLVGALAGRLCGLRTRALLLPVLGATTVSVAAWAFFTDALLHWAERFGEWAVFVVVGTLVALAAGAFLYWRLGPPAGTVSRVEA